MNYFAVHPEGKAEGFLAAAQKAMAPGADMYAAIELVLPFGCRFSLFLVTGFPDDETPMIGMLTVNRGAAREWANQLVEGEIRELKFQPPAHPEDS